MILTRASGRRDQCAGLASAGYKVHLTETCEDDAPNLITHVATTAAPVVDAAVTAGVHGALQAQHRLPQVHLVDTGSLDAELLVASRQEYGAELLGPTRRDQRWQARAAEGFSVEHFTLDWARRKAICPERHERNEWFPRVDNQGTASSFIRFAAADCGPCPSRARCTRSQTKYPRRALAVRPQAQREALHARRRLEQSEP